MWDRLVKGKLSSLYWYHIVSLTLWGKTGVIYRREWGVIINVIMTFNSKKKKKLGVEWGVTISNVTVVTHVLDVVFELCRVFYEETRLYYYYYFLSRKR